MKKLALVLLALVIAASASVAVASVRGTYKGLPVAGVVVNGRELKPDVPAVVMDGRTLLPLRAVAEALGAKVEWDGAAYTARVTLPRELTREEFPAWQDGYGEKVGALGAAYNQLFEELNQGRIDRASFNQRLAALLPQAEEVLRYSTSATSSDPEVRNQIIGAAAVGALAYTDVVLQVGSIENGRLREAAGLAHQAMVRLMEEIGAPSGSP